VLHCEQRACLRAAPTEGRRDRLVAIRQVHGHVDVELKFAGRNVQSGESNVGLDSADVITGIGERLPDWETAPLTTGVEVGPNPLA